MIRETRLARPDWRDRVEQLGFGFHTIDDRPYWDESACYAFTAGQIDTLEIAADTLHDLCIRAAGHVIERGLYARLGIPEEDAPLIEASWERDDFSLYGRFDLVWDGVGAPKMLEYNADTPTALMEAAVVQWHWLRDCFPEGDQFNSIHERLIAAWGKLESRSVHFASVAGHPEDEGTVLYLCDTAVQAGKAAVRMHMGDIGWNERRRAFTDLEEREIRTLFKLYPWEWLARESFGANVGRAATRWIEPPWKALLSNKGLLPILWELFPDHPNLLPAYESPEKLGGRYARKPKLGREGANVTLVRDGAPLAETWGEYGAEGFVYQALNELPGFDGNRPVLGVWVVDHKACGLGIREDRSLITGDLSRFVPHRIR